jgi:hypothetical protein
MRRKQKLLIPSAIYDFEIRLSTSIIPYFWLNKSRVDLSYSGILRGDLW